MILEWLSDLWAGICDWFLGMFPTDDAPDWAVQVGTFLGNIASSASGLGVWIPWVLLGSVGAVVLTTWLVLVSVKGIRWLWGLTPFSGGS